MKLVKKTKTHATIIFTHKELDMITTATNEFRASLDIKSLAWTDVLKTLTVFHRLVCKVIYGGNNE